MKTPREIILQKHQSAEAKLSALRPEDLAAIVRAGADRPCFWRGLMRQFWHEAILPWRRVWIGLAGVWVVIIGLDLTANVSPAPMEYAEAGANPQVLVAMRDQRRLLAQLLAPASPPDAVVPGKRSEERPTISIV